MKIDNCLIQTDRILDYVPVISTISNLVDIFIKCVLENKTSANKKDSIYVTYLNEKNYERSFILFIPVIGNLIIALYDLSNFLAHRVYQNSQTKRLNQQSSPHFLDQKIKEDMKRADLLAQMNPTPKIKEHSLSKTQTIQKQAFSGLPNLVVSCVAEKTNNSTEQVLAKKIESEENDNEALKLDLQQDLKIKDETLPQLFPDEKECGIEHEVIEEVKQHELNLQEDLEENDEVQDFKDKPVAAINEEIILEAPIIATLRSSTCIFMIKCEATDEWIMSNSFGLVGAKKVNEMKGKLKLPEYKYHKFKEGTYYNDPFLKLTLPVGFWLSDGRLVSSSYDSGKRVKAYYGTKEEILKMNRKIQHVLDGPFTFLPTD